MKSKPVNTDPGDEHSHVTKTSRINVNLFGNAQTDAKLLNRVLAALLEALLDKYKLSYEELTARHMGQGVKLPNEISLVRGSFIYLAKELGISATVAGEYIYLVRSHAAKELKQFKDNCSDDSEFIQLASDALGREFGR